MVEAILVFLLVIISCGVVVYSLYKEKRQEDIQHINEESCSSYSDLLKTKEWQDKRHKILERDHYKCRFCGATDKLAVHHKYYLQYPNHQKVKPWNYPDDALITLCNKCHYNVHRSKIIKVYYKKYDSDS